MSTKQGRNDSCPVNELMAQTSVPVNPAKIRRGMEQMLGNIGKVIESKNLSMEEANQYLQSLMGRKMDDINAEFQDREDLSDRDRAQILMDDAFEEDRSSQRRKIIQQALKLYPHLPDAWIMLGEDSRTPEEALSCFERAVEAGEKDLGEEFFKENEGHFWGMTESRPYMRAKASLADFLWELGREKEAITHYQDCLRLNPKDNQGLRDVLVNCLLIKNELDEVEKILRRYKNDFGAFHAFNKALFLFKKQGSESKKAVKQIVVAVQGNVHVPKYLLGKSKLPPWRPDSYSLGSREEAVIYVDEALRAWKETPGALLWLDQMQ